MHCYGDLRQVTDGIAYLAAKLMHTLLEAPRMHHTILSLVQ